MFVYLFYLATLALLILKSRLGLRVGVDHSKMFGTFYMSYMANQLCESLTKSCNEKFKRTGGIYSENLIIGRQLVIEPIKNNPIRLRITKDSYYSLIRSLSDPSFDGKYVRESEVMVWMQKNVYGKITKEKLDNFRVSNLSDDDMMMNTSFNYHPESVGEMQIIITALLWNQLYVPDMFKG